MKIIALLLVASISMFAADKKKLTDSQFQQAQKLVAQRKALEAQRQLFEAQFNSAMGPVNAEQNALVKELCAEVGVSEKDIPTRCDINTDVTKEFEFGYVAKKDAPPTKEPKSPAEPAKEPTK